MDEDKQGIYTSVALAGVLVMLSLVLLGVAGTGGIVGALADNADEFSEEVSGESSGSDGLSSDSYDQPTADSPSESSAESDQPTAEPPGNLAFLCDDDETETYSSGSELSVDQRNEAEAAAKRYVMAAYGFEGSDAVAHEQGVEEQVVGDCFWGSEPGGDTENMNEAVRQGSPQSASSDEIIEEPYFARAFVLLDVDEYSTQTVTHDASGAEYLSAEGTAVWLTEDSEGMYPREQALTLVKKKGEGQWKVSGGNAMRPNSTDYEQQAEEKIEQGEPEGGSETTQQTTG